MAVIPKPVRSSTLYDTIARIENETPLEQEERGLLTEAESEVGSLYPLKILLAEDHKINQKVIKKLLSKIGYSAEVANNGLEALERLENNQFDLVLLDVQMPVMDGISAAQEISKRMPQETRPWMTALTANATKEDRNRCLAAGMDDFLTKPIHCEQLKAALIHCHQERARSHPGADSEIALPH